MNTLFKERSAYSTFFRRQRFNESNIGINMENTTQTQSMDQLIDNPFFYTQNVEYQRFDLIFRHMGTYKHMLIFFVLVHAMYGISLLFANINKISFNTDVLVHMDRLFTIFIKMWCLYFLSNLNKLSIIGFVSGLIFSAIYVCLEPLSIFAFSYSPPVSGWSIVQIIVLTCGLSVLLIFCCWSIFLSAKRKDYRIISVIYPIIYLVTVLALKSDNFHVHHEFIGFSLCLVIQTSSIIGEICSTFFLSVWISGVALYGTWPLYD